MISAEALREKLSPPRALAQVGEALYGAPEGSSTRAWIAWPPTDVRGAMRGLLERARLDGAASLTVGGPPGNYLVSGVDVADLALCEALESMGFRAATRHLDLVVATADHARDPAVQSAGAELLPWIAETFSRTWAMEAERAITHDGLFAMRGEDGAPQGFACHSGNRAWEGSFGPVGVRSDARGGGVGRRLAATALSRIAERGFETATVPWVTASVAGFYESFCDVRGRTERVLYRIEIV